MINSDFIIAITLIAVVALGLPVTFQGIKRREEKEASVYFVLLCISNAMWGILSALFYLLPIGTAPLIIYHLRYVFIGYSCIFMYLFTLKNLKPVAFRMKTRLILFVFPLITVFIVLISPVSNFLFSGSEIVVNNGVRMFKAETGIWHAFTVFLCYTCLLMSFLLLISQYRKLPPNYKPSLIFMVSAIALVAAASVLTKMGIVPYGIDITPYAAQIAHIMVFFSFFNTNSIDLLFISMDAVFENAAYPILLLNRDGYIINFNIKAGEIGSVLGFKSLYNETYEDFFNKWIKKNNGRYFEEDEDVVSIVSNNTEIHYRLSKSDFYSDKNRFICTYVEIKDITPMMTLIHKLQDSAYFDQLTGLLNRRSFNMKLVEYDREEYLPLGIVAGDVNRLKLVNDTHGHSVGDLLLKEVTKVLQNSSPGKASWFRIGGDEFVALMPNARKEELDLMLANIEKGCRNFSDPRFEGAGIALAYKIKYHFGEDAQELLHEADIAMYAEKWDRRKNNN